MSMVVVSPLTMKLKIFTSALTVTAQALTVYKMIHRHVTHGLLFKWEDACAIAALIGSVICVVTSWTYSELADQSSVISFWIYVLTYPTVVWSVRLSILLSVLHITLPSPRLRRAMLFIAGLFVLTWLSLTITFLGRFVSSRNWYTAPSQQDKKQTRLIAIFELITDILSDGTLIGLAIHSLRLTKLSHPRQRLLIAAFSTNILVTVVSSLRAACQILHISTFIGVVIEIEVACSLFVCNSLFITTAIYRLLRRNDTPIVANTNVPGMRSVRTPGLQFTTVILDTLDAFGSMNDSTSVPRTATSYPSHHTGILYPDCAGQTLSDVNPLQTQASLYASYTTPLHATFLHSPVLGISCIKHQV